MSLPLHFPKFEIEMLVMDIKCNYLTPVELYWYYYRWCEKCGIIPPAEKAFRTWIDKEHPIGKLLNKAKTRYGRVYVGIGLRQLIPTPIPRYKIGRNQRTILTQNEICDVLKYLGISEACYSLWLQLDVQIRVWEINRKLDVRKTCNDMLNQLNISLRNIFNMFINGKHQIDLKHQYDSLTMSNGGAIVGDKCQAEKKQLDDDWLLLLNKLSVIYNGAYFEVQQKSLNLTSILDLIKNDNKVQLPITNKQMANEIKNLTCKNKMRVTLEIERKKEVDNMISTRFKNIDSKISKLALQVGDSKSIISKNDTKEIEELFWIMNDAVEDCIELQESINCGTNDSSNDLDKLTKDELDIFKESRCVLSKRIEDIRDKWDDISRSIELVVDTDKLKVPGVPSALTWDDIL